VPPEFLTPSLFIAQSTKMIDDDSFVERVKEPMVLEEAGFLSYFHHTMEKSRQKVWNYRHIRHNSVAHGDLDMITSITNIQGSSKCISLDLL